MTNEIIEMKMRQKERVLEVVDYLNDNVHDRVLPLAEVANVLVKIYGLFDATCNNDLNSKTRYALGEFQKEIEERIGEFTSSIAKELSKLEKEALKEITPRLASGDSRIVKPIQIAYPSP